MTRSMFFRFGATAGRPEYGFPRQGQRETPGAGSFRHRQPRRNLPHFRRRRLNPLIPTWADHPGAVIAPMIGTVYLQAQPGSPKFVEIGGAVEEGQILLIIEAMKTMNHIHAPRAGTVRRILVENNSVVEYGTPLMIIE